jgi:hypothetical protein
MIIFHIVRVISGADFSSGLRSRTLGEGGSVAIVILGRPKKKRKKKRKRARGLHVGNTKCKSSESIHDKVEPQ